MSRKQKCLCECGCGRTTNVITHTCRKKGRSKGQFFRFITGHNAKGVKHTEATKQKMSRPGRPVSAETRAKISASLSGRRLSETHKANMAAGMRGLKRHPDVGRKISEALKGKGKSAAHRAALSAANTGKPLPEAARAAMVATWRAKSYESRLAASAAGRRAANPSKHKGKHNRVWWSALDAEAQRRIVATRAAKLKANWSGLSTSERAARLERLRVAGLSGTRAARLAKPTTIETAIAVLLNALGVAYVAEYRIGLYAVDFFIPERAMVIECDGSYWHSKPNVKARDIVRDDWLSSHGYAVVRLSEADIRSGVAGERLKAMVA